MPKPIQTPDVSTQLQRLFGLKGRVRPALDEIIIPVVNVASLELRAAPSPQKDFAVNATIAAVVGEYGSVLFSVPAGTAAFIYAVRFGSDVDVQFNSTALGAPAFTSRNTYATDLRPGQDTSQATVEDGTSALNLTANARLKATNYEVLTPPWVIGQELAATNIIFQDTAANDAMQYSIYWREYAL